MGPHGRRMAPQGPGAARAAPCAARHPARARAISRDAAPPRLPAGASAPPHAAPRLPHPPPKPQVRPRPAHPGGRRGLGPGAALHVPHRHVRLVSGLGPARRFIPRPSTRACAARAGGPAQASPRAHAPASHPAPRAPPTRPAFCNPPHHPRPQPTAAARAASRANWCSPTRVCSTQTTRRTATRCVSGGGAARDPARGLARRAGARRRAARRGRTPPAPARPAQPPAAPPAPRRAP
jgi:hypothetical protein